MIFSENIIFRKLELKMVHDLKLVNEERLEKKKLTNDRYGIVGGSLKSKVMQSV